MTASPTKLTYFYWIGGCTTLMTLYSLIVGMVAPIGYWFPVLQLAGVFVGTVAAFIDVHSLQGR